MSPIIARQSFYSISEFTSDMEGWEFKSWMPNGRHAHCSWVPSDGATHLGCLRFEADGRDDDGIFFVQTSIKADIQGLVHLVGVRWSFKQPAGEIGSWPRVVYIGPPKDLARQETQHEFTWLTAKDNVPSSTPEWIDHKFHSTFPEGLEEVIVCIGWKINFETERTVHLDNIRLIGH